MSPVVIPSTPGRSSNGCSKPRGNAMPRRRTTALGEARTHREIVEQAGGRFSHCAANAGPAAARNAGPGQVTTPLVRWSTPTACPRDWLGPLLGHFDDPVVAAVAPRIVPLEVVPATALSRYDGVRSPWTGVARGAGPAAQPDPLTCRARRSSVRRGVAGDVLFDPGLRGGEDVDLVWRLVEAGWDVRMNRHPSWRTRAADLGSWLRRAPSTARRLPLLARRHPASLVPLQASAWSAASGPWSRCAGPSWPQGSWPHPSACWAGRLDGLVEKPYGVATKIAGGGTLSSALPALHGLTRAWSPALVLGLRWRRTRRPAALALVAPR